MTQVQAEVLADEYTARVLARTKMTRETLQCPREKSGYTPCIARDGSLAVVLNSEGSPLCVGCEAALVPLLEKERDA